MKFPWFRKQRDEELDAEIRGHLDEAIRDRIARGEAPDEARANALREFGNVGLVKEVTREMWGWASLERLLQDLRFGLRMLRKNPGFSLIAILTLALGIGANTAIFSVVNAVLLQPYPQLETDRWAYLWERPEVEGLQQVAVSAPNYVDWRR
ncbi:MAG: permease prefix domain 1-containing protein, partial [Blastocatellia bacterium]